MKKTILILVVAMTTFGICYAQNTIALPQTIVEYCFNSDKKVCIHNPHAYTVIVEYNVYCTISHVANSANIVGSKSVTIDPNKTYVSLDAYGSLAKDGGEFVFATSGTNVEHYYIQLKAYKLTDQK